MNKSYNHTVCMQLFRGDLFFPLITTFFKTQIRVQCTRVIQYIKYFLQPLSKVKNVLKINTEL